MTDRGASAMTCLLIIGPNTPEVSAEDVSDKRSPLEALAVLLATVPATRWGKSDHTVRAWPLAYWAALNAAR